MNTKLNLLAAGLLTMSGFVTAGYAADAVDLKVGDKAPTFAALDDTGKEWKSADHVGKKLVVVYFYPADMTGGCTKQACGFRDDLGKLADKGVEVVGVSGDSVRNHQLFKQAHDLNFALLADTEGKVADAFGVPNVKGEKSVSAKIDGKDEVLVRSVTAQRWTFVIDKDGKIAAKDTKPNAAEDSKAILKLVEGVQK
ncbi:MAG TPA: peroxiredoxin [Planctomycetaceae bacterium]|nr:peroxiredoxin [Planctomycetaceae bacterium]